MRLAAAAGVAATDRHSRRAGDALVHLIEHAPASGALALWMPHRDREGPLPTPVATDGRTLFYGPAFERLPLPQQAGCVAHAVLHVALCHVQRRAALQAVAGDIDTELFDLCADALVDEALAALPWLQLPPGALRLPALLARVPGLAEKELPALPAWDVEALYRAIDDRSGDKGRRDGPRAAAARRLARANGRGSDMLPGSPSDPPAQPGRHGAGRDDEGAATDAERAALWRERMRRAQALDGRESMLRGLVHDALPRSRTPWPLLLRTRLARAFSPHAHPSWSRPSRSWLARRGRGPRGERLPFEPGQAGPRPAARLALVLDVSGSIDEALLDTFAHEIGTIVRRHEAQLVLVAGDERVRAVHKFGPGAARPGLQALRVTGGGGTDFEPLLAEAARHAPDLIVVLTDLLGPTGRPPRTPVLWAVPAAYADALPPFGQMLVLDEVGAA